MKNATITLTLTLFLQAEATLQQLLPLFVAHGFGNTFIIRIVALFGRLHEQSRLAVTAGEVPIMDVTQQLGPGQIYHVSMHYVEFVTFLHGRRHAGSIQEGPIARTQIHQLVGTGSGVVAEFEMVLERRNRMMCKMNT